MKFSDAPAIEHDPVSFPVRSIVGLMDGTREIDARYHRKLPYDGCLSRDRERVFVIERRIIDAHRHIAGGQSAFLDRGEACAIGAFIPLDQNCFEHISPGPRRAAASRSSSGRSPMRSKVP